MTELSSGAVVDSREDPTVDSGPRDRPGSGLKTTERDRKFAKRIGRAALAWGLIWTVIVAALFLFGDAISALVV